jgi:peptide/nickel transport system substrate-binding protein
MYKRLTGLLMVGVLAVAACGSSTATTAPSAASAAPSPTAAESTGPTPEPTPPAPELTGSKYAPTSAANVSDQALIVAEWQTPSTMNYYYAQANVDVEVQTPALLGLIDTTYDLKYVGDLASEVPLVANGGVVVEGTGMTVTYKLKPGMKWSDGQPITCKDLEATWKWIMDPANTGLAGGVTGWEDIESVDTSSDTDCAVKFKNIYEGYLGLFSPLFPAHYITTVPVADAATKLYPLTDLASGVYSGPFMPTEYRAGAQLNYTLNPNWATINPNPTGFKSMIFKFYPDNPDGMIAGFSNGEYDLAMNLNHSDLPKIQGMDKVLTEDTFTYEQLSINNKTLTEKFGAADVLPIKQAIAYGIDKAQITGQVLGGTVDPIGTNNLSPLAWYFDSNTPASEFSVEKANAALDAAGWTLGSDGYRTKNGKTLELQFCTTTRPYRVDSLNVYASQMKAIGIKANTLADTANPNVFGGWDSVHDDQPCNLIHGNYDVAMFAWVAPLDPIGSYNVYHSKGIPDAPPHNGQNNTRTNIPEMDAAWDAVKTNVDFAKVGEAMKTVQQIYSTNVIEIPLFYWKNAYLVSPKLQNVTGNPTTSGVLWNVEDWWIQP